MRGSEPPLNERMFRSHLNPRRSPDRFVVIATVATAAISRRVVGRAGRMGASGQQYGVRRGRSGVPIRALALREQFLRSGPGRLDDDALHLAGGRADTEPRRADSER